MNPEAAMKEKYDLKNPKIAEEERTNSLAKEKAIAAAEEKKFIDMEAAEEKSAAELKAKFGKK